MAGVIALGSVEEMAALKEKLFYNKYLLSQQGLQIDLQQENRGSITVLTCHCEFPDSSSFPKEDNRSYFRHCMANIISELILSYWESRLLREIIKEEFFFFTPEEKEKIFKRSLEIIQTGPQVKCDQLLYRLNRKTKIIKRLDEYLAAHNQLNIEGFIKFRLKDYTSELREAVNYSVEELMMEKEYGEFIRLLRYFVEIQEPRMEKVHLLVKKQGQYRLFDSNQQEISSEYLDDFFHDFLETDINYDDLLISALITIAPKQIVIHRPEQTNGAPSDTMVTIEQVFSERLLNCPGCSWCTVQGRA